MKRIMMIIGIILMIFLLLLCITAIPVSKLGFSYLVNLLYPVFGLLGLVQVIYIVFTRKRVEKKSKN